MNFTHGSKYYISKRISSVQKLITHATFSTLTMYEVVMQTIHSAIIWLNGYLWGPPMLILLAYETKKYCNKSMLDAEVQA